MKIFQERSALTVLICFLACSFNLKAQKTSKDQSIPYKVSIQSDSIFEVAFLTDKKISNLLVTVFDNKGQLVFMDCQYNFSGPYKRSVALQQPVKNSYYLKITTDNEIFEKKLSTD